MSTSYLQSEITNRIDDLTRLVYERGLQLTHPNVVRKSMELDELVVAAMKEYRSRRREQ